MADTDPIVDLYQQYQALGPKPKRAEINALARAMDASIGTQTELSGQ